MIETVEVTIGERVFGIHARELSRGMYTSIVTELPTQHGGHNVRIVDCDKDAHFTQYHALTDGLMCALIECETVEGY